MLSLKPAFVISTQFPPTVIATGQRGRFGSELQGTLIDTLLMIFPYDSACAFAWWALRNWSCCILM